MSHESACATAEVVGLRKTALPSTTLILSFLRCLQVLLVDILILMLTECYRGSGVGGIVVSSGRLASYEMTLLLL